MGKKFPFYKMKRVMVRDGSEGTTLSVHLMPLSCPFKNGLRWQTLLCIFYTIKTKNSIKEKYRLFESMKVGLRWKA